MFRSSSGSSFFLYVGTSIFKSEIIFDFIFNDFFEDLLIIDANPKCFALDFFINFTHSKLDFPVVITSSIIRTLEFFLILKPLLSLNLPSTLSQKIVSFFRSRPISYPMITPPMGGVIIGYEIGRLLKKETIFCERVDGKFKLRRGFNIKKNSRVLIIEDVITTGKSSLECVKLIKKSKAKHLGFASIINRSSKKSLKIKSKIISLLKIEVPTYKKNELPDELRNIKITKPGSRFLK